MTSYDLHGGHRSAVALDSFPDAFESSWRARFVIDVEKTTEKIHNIEHLHQIGRNMTLRTGSYLSNKRFEKLATCRPCVKRLKSKLRKKSDVYRKKM